jgi:hypothetical protein
MATNLTFVAALKAQKRWADLLSILSIVLVVGLGGLAAMLGESFNADVPTRIGMYIIMAAIVIVVSVWQAAAFVAATLQMEIAQQRGGGSGSERDD